MDFKNYSVYILILSLLLLSPISSIGKSNDFFDKFENSDLSSKIGYLDDSNQSCIKIKEISGGLGLEISIQNIGFDVLFNISIEVQTIGGLFINPRSKIVEIPRIMVNESKDIKIGLFGFGLGIISTFPNVMIKIYSSEINYHNILVKSIIIGPFVKITKLYFNMNNSFEGYNLFSPEYSLYTYLIDNHGEIVHFWKSNYIQGLSSYLLENGNMVRTAFIPNPVFISGGMSGRIEMFNWNGSLIWEFRYSNDQYNLHHDIEVLPNGNVLMIAWEYKSYNESIVAGRHPDSLPTYQLWPDHIIEVKPNGTSGGDLVWEWHVWDHLIQDFDPSKDNYGVVEDHPELIDINYGIFTGKTGADLNHINSIDYNEEFDQILLSAHNQNEIWVIDHSTTTAEAASHSGGNSGMGGDILYRWGNPAVYKTGSNFDQKLFGQHDARWIQSGHPGEGNILIFNNGQGRPEGKYSSVDEIQPPVNEYGNYSYTPGFAFEPINLTWCYTSENPFDFYAGYLSGAQRLPNGNTLICDGPNGFFFEVTSDKLNVWQYINPYPNFLNNEVFKIDRYPLDYPGLQYLFD